MANIGNIATIVGNVLTNSAIDLSTKADLVNGFIPSNQLPSYVDDILEYTNLAGFPVTGASGLIYIAQDTNRIYRWTGSVYAEVSPTVGTTWGTITGMLSNQTDLQTALNAKQNNITAAALTKTDDTNVTLTLGGSPSTALLASTSLTLGWTGTLADSRIASAAVWNAKQAPLSGTGFVKASGTTISYDNSTYLTTSSASSTYLPLTGGTLTGALTGTSATFSGAVQTYRLKLVESTYLTNYTIYTGVDNSNSIGIYNETSGVYNLKIASTGAATFSSTIQATRLSLNVGLSSDRILYISANLPTTGANQYQTVINGTIVNAATNLYGLYVGNNTNVNITNSYALYLESTGGSGTITNKYGIYQTGSSDKNYFAGSVGIGVNPSSIFHVNVPETASNLSGVRIQGDTNGKLVVLGANATYAWIQSHGSVPLRINELGNDVLLNVSGGNTGIGFSTASYKLQVAGEITTHAGTNNSYYSYMNYLGTTYNFGSGETTDNVDFKIAGGSTWTTGGNFRFWTQTGNSTPVVRMCVNPSGNVSIGIGNTIGPRLDVRSNASYTAALTQPAFFGSNDVTGPLGVVIQTISGSGNAIRTEITSTRYGVSGNDLTLNRDSGAGSGGLTVKYQGNVGVNDANPSYKLDVNGDSRVVGASMIGGSIGLMQLAMDGARIYSYPYTVVHLKTSILKGSDTMISFNLRGYYYSPNTIDTDVAFYLYQPVAYVYGVTQHVKAYGGLSIGLYYSSDNYVCIYIDGLGTYGGVAINWINTSLITWGAKVTILGTTRVNTTATQY